MTSVPTPPRKRRRLLRWGGVFLLVAMAFLAGTAARLAQAPVVLPGWVLERVEARVNRDLERFQAQIGGIALSYDLESHALRLVLRETVVSQDDTALARLPVLRLGLDGPAVLRGEFRPRSVRLDGLEVRASRSADGAWSLALGTGGGAMPRSWPAALATLDEALSAPLAAQLDSFRLRDLRVGISDAVTGLEDQVEAQARLSRSANGVFGSVQAEMEAIGASIQATVARDTDGLRVEADLAGLNIGTLSAAMPRVPALSLGRGGIDATAAFSLASDGSPGPLEGRIALRNVASVSQPRMAADRMTVVAAWTPGTAVVSLQEISASSDEAQVTAEGQLIFDDGLTGPVQIQLHVEDLRLDPDGMFEQAAVFETGLIEARLTQVPLSLEVGQAMIRGPSGQARAGARLQFPDTGVTGEITLTVPEMAIPDLRPLWPERMAPGARRWFMTNLLDGVVSDVTAVVQLRPGQEPTLAASLAFRDTSFRYMRFMPPAIDASGVIQFTNGRATVRADQARVDVGSGAGIDISGTRIVLPDALSRPPEGQVALLARGEIGDVLELLDNPPIRLLERLRKTRDLATGQAVAIVDVVLPLRPGNAPSDINWSVQADLTDVTSDLLVPGRRITGDTLRLRASPTLFEISGPLVFQGVPFDGTFRQALPPPLTERVDPDNPPPPRPLPEPGRVQGTASVTPEGLANLGLRFPTLNLTGRADVVIDILLPQGEPPQLKLQSDLQGMAAALPAIGWTKSTGSAADLAVEAVLGANPQVTRLALDAPGLRAEGQVRLNEQSLRDIRFTEVRTPWFRGPVTLTARGAGQPLQVTVSGGQADLRTALAQLDGGGSGSGGGGGPLQIALDRLQVSDAIALTDLRASLQGGSGTFSGGVNGGQAVSGVLAPRNGGTVVQIRTDNAGAVLRSTGLFRDARGGEMTLTLQSPAGGGPLQGALRGSNIRVRDAPALASLLQTLSVVGLLEQLGGQGLPFNTVTADFVLQGDNIRLSQASAVGPSMSITADGVYDAQSKRIDMQGVVSPIYFVNGLFGALFSRRDEGLFGFTYQMRGPVAQPQVAVNPLSILTPGRFRDIFRAPPPTQ